MEDDAPEPPRPMRLKKDGTPDLRGRSEGSRTSQFARGDGRRRPGRRKGAKDERTEVHAIRDMRVPRGNGSSISLRRAMMLRVAERAVKGDLRAIDWLDRKIAQHEPPIVDPDLSVALAAEDAEILRAARERGLLDPGPADTDRDTPAQLDRGTRT